MSTLRITMSAAPLPERHHAQITDPKELANVLTVTGRADTALLLVENVEAGDMAAYMAFGLDQGGMVTIYAARSWEAGFGAIAMKAMFKGATMIDRPLRVHCENLKAYMRMFGASEAAECFDADGIRMGVFRG